ncbi:MAG: ParB/RepB/Spo0J family partition protein [Campylobacterales bacterium]|nr:ParB/RepB/Spo0J family partition protein [Campylobacterota bacterium]MBD3842116.1 ParB/RepB/Spo0J family partition protein [Campylobacterales bacterium]
MAKKKIDYNVIKMAVNNAALTEQFPSITNLEVNEDVQDILLNDLNINPYQPRIEMDPFQLESLTTSIQQDGLLQPILVTPITNQNKYYIIAGHRRVEAFRKLGKTSIKSIVFKDVNPKQLAILPLIENLQRDDMDPLENAIAFKRLLDDNIFSTQDELAEMLSLSKSWVSRMLSVLKLPDDLINLIKVEKYNDINVLNALNKLDDAKQISTFQAIRNMQRSEALQYINSIAIQKKEVVATPSRLKITKAMVQINTKNLDQDKKIAIEKYIEKIREILEK